MWALLTLLELSSLFAAPPAKIPDRLQSAIKLSQHTIERDGAGFKAVNWNQNLDLRFDRSAVLVRLPDAEVRLRLAGYGRGSELAKPMPATLTASKNRLEYHRGTLTEWYVNDASGLEQGFTLAERPDGLGALVMALEVEGGVTPRLDGSDAVALERNGAAVLRYAGLKAWDAQGRKLDARMEVRGSAIRLAVDDAAQGQTTFAIGGGGVAVQ